MRQVLDFLRELAENNDRAWFGENKGRYKEAEATFNAFGEELIGLIGEFDPLVRGLTLRDCTYRIYRDTRFSHDKTPYKTHIGLYVCPGGKKADNAGYYFHLEPGNCLLDAGIYMPEKGVLASVRDEIFDNGAAVMAAIAKARGFELDMSNSLKKLPAGYPSGEWDNLLKLRDFHICKHLEESDFRAEEIAADFRTTLDFMTLMNRAAAFAHENG